MCVCAGRLLYPCEAFLCVLRSDALECLLWGNELAVVDSSLFQTALLSINESRMALPLVPSVINTLIYSALAVPGSAGQPGKRLFSGSVLFFVITVQVAALSSGSIKPPQPVLQLESEREASAGANAALSRRIGAALLPPGQSPRQLAIPSIQTRKLATCWCCLD